MAKITEEANYATETPELTERVLGVNSLGTVARFLVSGLRDTIRDNLGAALATSISFDGGTNALARYIGRTSWPPVIADAETGGNTGSFTGGAFYSRFGDIVVLTMNVGNIDTSGMTATNDVYIRNLPFACATGSGYEASGAPDFSTISLSNWPTFSLAPGASAIRLKDGTGGMQVQDITSGSGDIRGTLVYITDAA